MTDLPANSLAARFIQRVAERDSPPPPPPLSQEPTAVAARVATWLSSVHYVRDSRSQRRLSRMLVALMETSECDTAQLAQAAGLGPRMAARSVVRLAQLGITDNYYRGLVRYHRLTRSAEDALLLVVVGPQ